jgi:hypothetical protein
VGGPGGLLEPLEERQESDRAREAGEFEAVTQVARVDPGLVDVALSGNASGEEAAGAPLEAPVDGLLETALEPASVLVGERRGEGRELRIAGREFPSEDREEGVDPLRRGGRARAPLQAVREPSGGATPSRVAPESRSQEVDRDFVRPPSSGTSCVRRARETVRRRTTRTS